MNLVTFISNIILFVFTCLVLLTDGISKEPAYIILTLLMLLVPILNVVVNIHNSKNNGWLNFLIIRKTIEEKRNIDKIFSKSAIMKILTITGNVVLFGFMIWAFVSTYPHPKEDGFIPYVVISFLTPVLNLVTIVFNRDIYQ